MHWGEAVAALCGIAALIAYYGLRDDMLTNIALAAGIVALAWSVFEARR